MFTHADTNTNNNKITKNAYQSRLDILEASLHYYKLPFNYAAIFNIIVFLSMHLNLLNECHEIFQFTGVAEL